MSILKYFVGGVTLLSIWGIILNYFWNNFPFYMNYFFLALYVIVWIAFFLAPLNLGNWNINGGD